MARLATFNIESLDVPPKARATVAERAEILRPQLKRLNADVLCLQEVNSQHRRGSHSRKLEALDALLDGTQYASYSRATSDGVGSGALTDVHNLVILSRFPISSHIELKHTFVAPIEYQIQTAVPSENNPCPVFFERPALLAEVALQNGDKLTVINLHLRAPLASPIAGQKLAPFCWKSSSGWAEGYFLSGLKRCGQALEVRLALDKMFDADPNRLIAVCGDFNAEDHETPIRILQASEEDTGNPHLAVRSLVVADRALPHDRRYSVIHHGRPQMLDHILITRSLAGCLKGIDAHNEALGDEAGLAASVSSTLGSYHAPVVAEFSFP